MWWCEGKLNRKTANFPLPSVAQKSHVLKLPIVRKPNIFAQYILCLPLSKTPQKLSSLFNTVIFFC